MKSWSSSYTYTSDGKSNSETIHNSYNNGEKLYENGYTRINNGELKEKFYKREINQINNNEKSLLGKSKNKEDWELLGINNNKKENKKKKYVDISRKYLERPSSSHRLTNSIIDKKSNKNTKTELNLEDKLSNMIQEMNISMFDNDDFFRF